MDRLYQGDVKLVSEIAFNNFNIPTRKRVELLSNLHEWISLGDHLQGKDAQFCTRPALDTYMEERDKFFNHKMDFQTQEPPDLIQA